MARKCLVNLIDLKKRDRQRIQYLVSDLGFEISPDQADQLAEYLRPLPNDDDEIMEYLVDSLEAVPFDEDLLKDLSAKYTESRGWQQEFVEKKLFILTRGLDSHPDWYQNPCMCADCRSYT